MSCYRKERMLEMGFPLEEILKTKEFIIEITDIMKEKEWERRYGLKVLMQTFSHLSYLCQVKIELENEQR